MLVELCYLTTTTYPMSSLFVTPAIVHLDFYANTHASILTCLPITVKEEKKRYSTLEYQIETSCKDRIRNHTTVILQRMGKLLEPHAFFI